MEGKKLHTFVICAYKESQYLEECIVSLINQETETNILISTSTPNDYIEELANKYNIIIDSKIIANIKDNIVNILIIIIFLLLLICKKFKPRLYISLGILLFLKSYT